MSATIKFEKNYRREIIYLEHGDDLEKLELYAQRLKQYSTAAITGLAVTTKKVVTMPESSGLHDSVTLQAKSMIREVESGKLWGIVIPAPMVEIFEEVPNEGYRVRRIIGDELAVFYTQYAGVTMRFEDGWLVGGR